MAKTQEQLDALYAIIQADATLAEHGKRGRDQNIADALNAVRQDIDVPRGTVVSNEFLTLLDPADLVGMTPTQTQSFGLFLASGSVDLSSQPVDALADAMPTKTREKIIAHKTRKGSIAERDLGGPVEVNDVSKALKKDRPNGRANNAN